MAGNFVFVSSPAFFGFIAGNSSGHGVTFWAILLYCSPLVLLMAAVSVMLAVTVKRVLIRRLSPAAEITRWKDIISSLIIEPIAITGTLIFTVYAFEEWTNIGSTYRGDGWLVVFLTVTALLSSLIMIVPHMRLLSGKFGDLLFGTSLIKRVAFAFRLGLVGPCVFAAVVLGLLAAFSK